MSILSNKIMNGANDPGFSYGPKSNSDALASALRDKTETSPVSGFGLSDASKLSSALSGVHPGFGVVGAGLGLIDKFTDKPKTTETVDKPATPVRDMVGVAQNVLGAAAPFAPPAAALAAALRLGTTAYDSYKTGMIGDAMDSRTFEKTLDAYEGMGYTRAQARVMAERATRGMDAESDPNGDGIGRGTDGRGLGGDRGVDAGGTGATGWA